MRKTIGNPSGRKELLVYTGADLNVFTIYYLVKYKYITQAQANACMFDGIGSLQDLLEVFNIATEAEFTSSKLWTLELIEFFRNLIIKLSDPVTYQEEYEIYRKRYLSYLAKNERKEKRRLENIKWQESLIRLEEARIELFKKLSGSPYGDLLNSPIKIFIEKEQISKRLAAILLAMPNIHTAMDLLKVYMTNRIEFLNQRGLGALTHNELMQVCKKYIDKGK